MNRVKSGFTLVELMLAMTFVSFLLVAICMTVIQISEVYNRGLTIKDVNQAGRSLGSDLQTNISSSMPFSLTGTGIGQRYVSQSYGGRLCTGQYSYIWNYGSAIHTAQVTGNNSSLNSYNGSTTTINFIRVADPTSNYCVNATSSGRLIEPASSTELMNAGEHTLAIHNFTIVANTLLAGDPKTNQQIYSISYVVGTNGYNGNIPTHMTDGSGNIVCRPPNDINSDPAYCAIVKFDILALAGNIIR